MTEPKSTGLSANAAAALSYVTFIPAIVFLLTPPYNSIPFVRFHAWQSVFLTIGAFVATFVLGILTIAGLFFGAGFILQIGRAVWYIWPVLWAVCVVQALCGKQFKLPILGDLAARQVGLL